jgi:hypothetical protein
MADETNPKCKDGDMIIVGPELGGGVHPFVRHHASHKIQVGLAKEATPEEASQASLHLTHREGNLFDVQPLSKGGSDAKPTKGPSQVSTPAFRTGWDNIFGKKAQVGQA